MRISELPTPYRQLAKYRRSWLGKSVTDDDLFEAFPWQKSPEKHTFWDAVGFAREIIDLPGIPVESYNALHEIAKTDEKVYNWLHLHWEQDAEKTGDGIVDTVDNLQTFKMALECVHDAEDPESLFDDLELVYNIAAIIATKGDITIKELERLKHNGLAFKRRCN